MSDKVMQQSVSEEEMDLWHRIIGKRRAEWSSLPVPDEIASIVTPLWNTVAPEEEINDPWQRTEFILKGHFTISIDRRVEPKKRRTAWQVVSTLLQKLDDARGTTASQQRQGAAPNKEPHASIPSSDLISQKSTDLTVSPLTQTKKPLSLHSIAPTAAQESSSSTTYMAPPVAAVQGQVKEKAPQQTIQKQKKPAVAQNEPATLPGVLSHPQQKQHERQQPSTVQQKQQQPSAAPSKPANGFHAPSQRQQQQQEPPTVQEKQQQPSTIQQKQQQPSASPSKPASGFHAPSQRQQQQQESPDVQEKQQQQPSTVQQQQQPSAAPSKPASGFHAGCKQQQQHQESPAVQEKQQQQPSTIQQKQEHPSAAPSKPVNGFQAFVQHHRQRHVQKQQRQQLPAVPSEPLPISSTKPATVNVVPARATPTPPTSVLTQRTPQASKGKPVGSKGSAFSSTAKAAPATVPKKAAPPPRILPPISISFGPDTQKYAAAVDKNGRSSVRMTIQPRQVSTDEYTRTLTRLERWDRYWKMERIISVVETFPISRLEHLQVGTKPQQATECTITLDSRDVSRVRDWGRPVARDKRYAHGETRLIVRMLPLKPGQKKKPRADTHQWPKGTFVQLDGMPVFIDQRRQQQHDLTEWKGMSIPLDLSSLVRNPTKSNKLQLYFLDNEPYIVCVALCSYVAPEILNNIVWSNDVSKLSMEEATAKALENANTNTVLLDEFTSNSNEMSSFIFPLCCPISQQLIQTPVRGTSCNHWQCFELRNFVESNAHITGTRWECPVCTKILSLNDLQYCPLTASILKQYSKDASPYRDRIQFFANGAWKLLDEAKKRHSKKRPAEGDNMNGIKKARSYGVAASKSKSSSPEVIELD
jgi:hypothetical protein